MSQDLNLILYHNQRLEAENASLAASLEECTAGWQEATEALSVATDGWNRAESELHETAEAKTAAEADPFGALWTYLPYPVVVIVVGVVLYQKVKGWLA